MGFLDTCGNTLLIALHGKAVEPYMQALHFFFGVGAVLSPVLIGAAMGDSESYGGAFLLYAAFLGLVSVALFLLPSPAEQPMEPTRGDQKQEEEARGGKEGGGWCGGVAEMCVPFSAEQRGFMVSVSAFLGVYVGLEATRAAKIPSCHLNLLTW